MGYYRENLENGGCYISNIDARNTYEAASMLFDYVDGLHKPIMDFYDKHPHKACDKTSWEREEVFINNLWKEARKNLFQAKVAWKLSRSYFEPGEWD